MKHPIRREMSSMLAKATAFVLAVAPIEAFAATNENLQNVIDLTISYLNRALYLLMALAVVMFVWYVIKYFIRPDTEKKDAGKYVMYSVLGFFVILSIWGLVNILSNTFGIDNAGNAPTYEQINDLLPQ